MARLVGQKDLRAEGFGTEGELDHVRTKGPCWDQMKMCSECV